ncbi:MAG: amidase [Actinomycetota bacterium]|nr:amidase [Actinomycetota bacterium]MDA8207911.1 amidase [Actinomycetota bacterium]
MRLHEHSVRNLVNELETKRVSAREVVLHFLDRIDRHNTALGAVVATNPELSLRLAAEVDERRAQGRYLRPLAGVPFAVKDLEDCTGFPTTMGSALRQGSPPATSDSLLVERLRQQGAIPIAKTNTPEFGWKGSTENMIFPPTRNPWDMTRTSGGSSGGTAAAVAAGLVPFGTASDGGGSMRIPAALCGIFALKTSTGRVPVRGPEAPNWWDLATAGPMARSVADTAWLYDFCLGPHIDDQRSLPKPQSDWGLEVLEEHSRPRVGVTYDFGYWKTDGRIVAGINRCVVALEAEGFEIVEVPKLLEAAPTITWMKLAGAYQARTLGPLLGTPEFEKLDPGLQEMVQKYAGMSARDFITALDDAWRISARFFAGLEDVDLLIAPVTAGLAPKIGERGRIDGEETIDWISYTTLANMTRTPAASVRVGFSDGGLPLAVQVMGKRFSEIEVLRLARFIEAAFGVAMPPAFAD